MERRQMLKCLLAGGVSATLSAPVFAQQGVPRPQQQTLPQRVATKQDGDRIVVTTPEELEPILKEWEEKTAIIKRLEGVHYRYEYDSVFAVEKRTVGEFWYEAPDKGRIDFKPASLTDPKTGQPLESPKKTSTGQRYSLKADDAQSWVCDGKTIIQIEHAPKTYGLAEIPPQHQGENIMDGPLPFLFGMKAEKIKQRYELGLGTQHNKTGSDKRKKYHIVAAPKLQADAREWQRAEVILDAEYCLPSAIRLIAPGGGKETVYVFPLGSMKPNARIWIDNPFRMSLRGYKLVEQQTAPPPAQGQGAKRPVMPVNNQERQPLGRATMRDNQREQ